MVIRVPDKSSLWRHISTSDDKQREEYLCGHYNTELYDGLGYVLY